MSELTTVYLIGSIGRAVNLPERFELDVKSPAELIRAVNVITNGALERYLAGPARNRLYRIAIQKRTNVIDPQEATHRSGRSTIYIIPTIRGRNSGVGKVIAGIGLIALAYFTGGLSAGVAGWAGTAAGGLTIAGSVVIGFGISLILGGITQLLTPSAQGPNASPENAQGGSTSFPGNASAILQGIPVPIVYGRALVAPLPVSITISNNDVSSTAAGTLGDVIGTPLDGGGTQYQPGNSAAD